MCVESVAYADFNEASVDGGLLLLRELDRRLGLVHRVAAVLSDPRDPEKFA